MGTAELATMILMFCGTPNGLNVDEVCVHHINNCAVERGGTISEKRVKECLLMRPSEYRKIDDE